jgi:hypothetical protein
MKARVKETGDIVDATYQHTAGDGVKYYDIDKSGYVMMEDELDFDFSYSPDYWARLEHQYAGMAMQGMIRRAYEAYCDDCANYENMIFEDAQALLKDHAEVLADVCVEYAHALVKKMKEERK